MGANSRGIVISSCNNYLGISDGASGWVGGVTYHVFPNWLQRQQSVSKSGADPAFYLPEVQSARQLHSPCQKTCHFRRRAAGHRPSASAAPVAGCRSCSLRQLQLRYGSHSTARHTYTRVSPMLRTIGLTSLGGDTESRAHELSVARATAAEVATSRATATAAATGATDRTVPPRQIRERL